MNYYDLRKRISKLVPRMTQLFQQRKQARAVKEKGRKSGYHEFKLTQKKWVKQERLLNLEEINSFVEVSCRAAACPMPLNLDVWDGLLCPFACKYCFANAFRASLYTAFFDNSKTMGLRHCNPDKYKKEMDKLLEFRGKDPHTVQGEVAKSIAMEIPIRFGIRFEDFTKEEAKHGISLELLRYLAEQDYPTMINTKSDLLAREDYLESLTSNEGKTAVHVTLISADDRLLKAIEPGAPNYEARMLAMATLVKAGIRTVARIEPFLPFVGDAPGFVEQYMKDLNKAGVRHITFDTWSYTAHNPRIRQSFINCGIDWERLFLAGCDSQALGSLLLGSFMQMFRDNGFSCSTFDMGNVPSNDQSICCEVGDWFEGGFNHGSTVMASRFIQEAEGAVSWDAFKTYVNTMGGFLSPALEEEVHRLWNVEGNTAYSHSWSAGMEAVGRDKHGIVWRHNPDTDFREDLLEGTEL